MRPLYFFLLSAFFIFSFASQAQPDTTVYHLTIAPGTVNKTGKAVVGLQINGEIPGPTLRFTEGDYAVICVENQMEVETSVHWHGLLLPNYYDGVPYLTTPPIAPGTTFKYEFPIRIHGTYWYHSHTQLQEQRGVYGSIVIEPKAPTLTYDKDLVVVFSDWTNEKPEHVLKNLKRGNEWYNIRKGTSTPLNRVIGRGAFGAQLNFWRQRMESADIADVYYPAFLTNGQRTRSYPELKPGEKVRVRIINAAASSQFWITFGGEDPLLVSADGNDVVPVVHNKTFIGIAETYDFIVTLPPTGQVEIRATAQDGSGHTSAYLGQGDTLSAPEVPRPDKIGMMKQMAQMDMRMGAPAMKFQPNNVEPEAMMQHWGMKMEGDKDAMHNMKMSDKEMGTSDMEMSSTKDDVSMNHPMHHMADSSKHGHHHGMNGHATSQPSDMEPSDMDGSDMDMPGMGMYAAYTYDFLKSPEPTAFPEDAPVNEMVLNLTGNMWRYIWSINGVPLNESDQLKIKQGEVTRITLNNLTMMHHPMHLHGHFFRVVNANGARSPLKHTVNVPPMQKITIEFLGNEYGDWFFHCHVLYHMNSGMARIFSYDTPRDQRLVGHPLLNLVNEANHYFFWGTADVASHMTEVALVASNIRNQFNVSVEYGWNQNLEAEISYERYLYDYFRVFVGVNLENEGTNQLSELAPTAVAGIRFFTPYMFDLDARIDNQLRPELRLSREVMILPRTMLFGAYEYQADFGWVTYPNETTDTPAARYQGETTWSAGLEYFLARNVSLMASYDNRFGAGGGLSVRF
ncbi:hypothetical protein SAMN05421823_113136 [Catalinimonas alkaloidigena]|uniref:Copper-resistance protein, CopA family n=1 Tax=Catalinimonas alkaloidigena TaxID=1075417 RepID=A0A1G9TBE1_9BACT|nr:multicopper oxidase domain-containing protein [Catalinimonas alkaloidigena]SDM44465.1 hypothetical protein SAMN05421823_113136 [Catalinimonas alkaloidigena]